MPMVTWLLLWSVGSLCSTPCLSVTRLTAPASAAVTPLAGQHPLAACTAITHCQPAVEMSSEYPRTKR
eukprot:2776055-Prymnesium_polylepis.1